MGEDEEYEGVSIPQPDVSRIEIIGPLGRTYVVAGAKNIQLSYQDGGGTLKIFIDAMQFEGRVFDSGKSTWESGDAV